MSILTRLFNAQIVINSAKLEGVILDIDTNKWEQNCWGVKFTTFSYDLLRFHISWCHKNQMPSDTAPLSIMPLLKLLQKSEAIDISQMVRKWVVSYL